MAKNSSANNPAESLSQAQNVEVLLAEPLPRTLTYRLTDDSRARPGQLVEVPLAGKKTHGVILGPSQEAIPENKLKDVLACLDHPPLKTQLLEFIQWVSSYCMTPAGNVFAMVLGGQSFKINKRPRKTLPVKIEDQSAQKPELSPAQKEAADQLCAKSAFAVFLLDGVTGSGKTEVYCEAIAKTIASGKQALLMLPEIALSAQITERLKRRFGFAPTLWHSELTPRERRLAWKAVLTGESRLVIGARSSLFLPFNQLGLIIVDEEHDTSYKQDEGVIYHARDMAIVRGKIEDIPVVLSSATPSVESWVNMQAGKYHLVHLPDRHGDAVMPDIRTIDLRQEKLALTSWIGQTLQAQIKETLGKGEQVLLFLNRRGYAPLTLCRQCGHRFSCPQCSAWLVEHRQEGKHRLVCHHCDFGTLYPSACPSCKATDTLAACGPGAERLDENVHKLFPNARRAILTSDTLGHLKELQATIEAMEKGEIDILIGTQLVAKGYHFPKLTLVGVIDGDLGLQGGDLRAAERTFQLLTQVAGRSGRASARGKVFIQTTQPQHPVMTNLISNDRDALLATLIKERETFSMPPFGRLVTLTLSGTNQAAVENACQAIAKIIPAHDHVQVLGPAPAPMAMLRGRYRLRFLIKGRKQDKLQDFISTWLSGTKFPSGIRLHIDIDPYHFV
jgi:primosomal protein N' (replication factor Y)